MDTPVRVVTIEAAGAPLTGDLALPDEARALVLFAHGSGSSRHSPRNQRVARELHRGGLGTLLIDLLSEAEEREDQSSRALRFDIPLLAGRLIAVVDWLSQEPACRPLHLGLFGASTGAAAALLTAAERPERARAVVSRGGRPDLAGAALGRVATPTLLLVGSHDAQVLTLNRQAMALMPPQTVVQLDIIEGASHLFTEPGTLEAVADRAREWFQRFLSPSTPGHPAGV